MRAGPTEISTARTSGGEPKGLLQRFLEHPDILTTDLPTAVLHAVTAWAPTAGSICAIVLSLAWVVRAVRSHRQLERWWADARLITITPPPEVEESGGPAFWGNLIGLMRPPLRRLLEGQPHLAFEYTWTSAGARIQIWVPGVIPPGLIERAVEAAWPGAHTRTAPLGHPEFADDHSTNEASAADPDPVPLGGVSTGGVLRLARTEVLPLATGHDADPLRAVFGAATGLGPGQFACVQILARPVTGARLRRARRAMRRLRAGQSAKPVTRLLDLITPGPSRTTSRPTRAPADPELSAQVRAALTKSAEPAWETQLRYALTALPPHPPTTRGERRRVTQQLMPNLRGHAHALASAFALYSGRNFLTRTRLRHPAAALAMREFRGGDLLSVTELAALGHLPLDAATPGLARAGARAVAPPPGIALTPSPRPRPALAPALRDDLPGLDATQNEVTPSEQQGSEPADDPQTEQVAAALDPITAPLPQEAEAEAGETGAAEDRARPPAGTAGAGTPVPASVTEARRERAVKVLGDTDIGPRRQVSITVADSRHHVHVIGATGSGKSTLMIHMILSDIAAGRGVLVIDPKGDLVLDLLDRIPERAAQRLVLIDPDDSAPPPCLNPLDLAPGADLDNAVDNLVGIFRRIFSGFWGPRTDDILRAASLTLLRTPHQPGLYQGSGGRSSLAVPTLIDIPRLLDDDTYRQQLTAQISDEVLAGFWGWYDHLTDGMKATTVGPVLNKLRAFLLRSFVRDAIAAGPATLDMTKVLNGGIGLVRLPKGVLGEETSRLLGSFVVARAWQAASARARAGTPRIDAGLYIDEAHNFLTLPYPIEDMLAEARGYRLSMVLAHQNLAQLPKELREGISANARNKVFFNASPEDSRDLERHTLPTLRTHDLSHLGAFQAAARLVVGSGDTPAFTLRTRPLPPPVPGRAQYLRAHLTATAQPGRPAPRREPVARPQTVTRPRNVDPRLQFQPSAPTSADLDGDSL
jgi:hypothetical protein